MATNTMRIAASTPMTMPAFEPMSLPPESGVGVGVGVGVAVIPARARERCGRGNRERARQGLGM